MSQLDSNWSFVDDSKVTPKGFLFAGISAGLKASNKKDLALILAPEGSIFSGMFTQSIVRASCVDICEERIKTTSGFVRAILINSGQANACTGDLGIQHFKIASAAFSKLLSFKSLTKFGRFFTISFICIGTPITPVEHIKTSSSFIPISSAIFPVAI